MLGAASLAAQSPQVELAGSQVLSVSVGNDLWPAARLRTGNSSGEVEFLDQGGMTIDSADDFDLSTYFSRNGGVPPEWDVDLGSWLDPDPGKQDFFVFEAAGNDTLSVRPRLAGGVLGAATMLSGWSPANWTLTSGLNILQSIEVVGFAFEDLRGPDGQPLAPGMQLEGLRFESSTVDGALVLVTTDAPLLSAVPPADLTVSPQFIPLGDSHQTQVSLRAEPYASGGFPSNSYALAWDVPGAQFLAGTGPSDPVAVVSFDGVTPAQVDLRVWPPGSPHKAHVRRFELGLQLQSGVELHGARAAWQPMELWFHGPPASALDDSPHPFLDRRLDLTLLAPDGSLLAVPGFYDGDGRGSSTGGVWKVRLTPELSGGWTFLSSFRTGPDVAIDASPIAGSPGVLNGITDIFWVKKHDAGADGFHARGTLRSTDSHYQQFDDGSWFLKGGVGGPENLLAFRGFEDVQKHPGSMGVIHEFKPHLSDWGPDSGVVPSWTWPESRAIFGALDYLGQEGVNSLYFLPMNLGGDGWDVAPFIGYAPTAYDRTRYHPGRLLQWEALFTHAQRRGIHLQFILAETEPANETWLDGGGFGDERKLFLREMVARFAHHNALKWNLSEENDFAVADLLAMAGRIRALDPYDHAIAVHNKPYDFSDYEALKGDPRIDSTSIQYAPDLAGQLCEEWRHKSSAAGRPWVIDLDENQPPLEGLSATNADDLRKRVLWDVYLSGGQLEWYLGAHSLPIGGDQDLEDFRTREEMWGYMRHAREFVESLPFWQMLPQDGRLTTESNAFGGGEVFVLPDQIYAVYLPSASSSGLLEIQAGEYRQRWFDPREGVFAGNDSWHSGPAVVSLGEPPADPNEDWVALIERANFWPDTTSVSVSTGGTQVLSFDGGSALASRNYLVLGSLSGTEPHTVWPGVMQIPLVLDTYFAITLFNPSTPLMSNNVGVLDAQGKTSVSFQLPGGALPGLQGLSAHHALITPFTVPAMASNPVRVEFVP